MNNHLFSLFISCLFVHVALFLQVQQVEGAEHAEEAVKHDGDAASFLQTKLHDFQKLQGSLRCEPIDHAAPVPAKTEGACLDKCAEAADCAAFSYFSAPYSQSELVPGEQCFLFNTCTDTTALEIKVSSYYDKNLLKEPRIDTSLDDDHSHDASSMPSGLQDIEDREPLDAEDAEEADMDFELLPAIDPGEKRRNTCEQCLHSGMDYCIQANVCMPRGQQSCNGGEDHVTGDADVSTTTGAKFLECPEDSELLDGNYIMVHGHISEKVPTLFKEKLTLREARNKCTQKPDCHGITMENMPSSEDETVLIEFKSASDLVHSSWVSYIFVERADAWTRAHYVPKAEVVTGKGFLAPQIQSEAVPGKIEEFSGVVHNLVGKTFASVAHNVSKDVLVNCFAPWCGWCQQFKPTFAKFAKTLQHVKTLEFAQIDATRNSIDDIDITRFPTALLFRAGSNKTEVLRYPGQRTPELMRAWLHKYVTYDFADYPPQAVQSNITSSEGGLLGDSDDL